MSFPTLKTNIIYIFQRSNWFCRKMFYCSTRYFSINQ